jgi:hypothetical protein
MFKVLSEGEEDKYLIVCEDAVAARMAELLEQRGEKPLTVVAERETREEAVEEMRRITAERRERRRAERDGKGLGNVQDQAPAPK